MSATNPDLGLLDRKGIARELGITLTSTAPKPCPACCGTRDVSPVTKPFRTKRCGSTG